MVKFRVIFNLFSRIKKIYSGKQIKNGPCSKSRAGGVKSVQVEKNLSYAFEWDVIDEISEHVPAWMVVSENSRAKAQVEQNLRKRNYQVLDFSCSLPEHPSDHKRNLQMF